MKVTSDGSTVIMDVTHELLVVPCRPHGYRRLVHLTVAETEAAIGELMAHLALARRAEPEPTPARRAQTECTVCQGLGSIETTGLACRTCGGSGWVWVPMSREITGNDFALEDP